MKIHIKKGDIVKVIAGDSKGSQGKVLMVDVEKYRAMVEGVNLVSKHTKANAKNPNGGIVKTIHTYEKAFYNCLRCTAECRHVGGHRHHFVAIRC